jgi:hypothetical protein
MAWLFCFVYAEFRINIIVIVLVNVVQVYL